MTELVSGLLFCDTYDTTGSDGEKVQKMAFNAGRLVGGLILMVIMGAIGWFTFPF